MIIANCWSHYDECLDFIVLEENFLTILMIFYDFPNGNFILYTVQLSYYNMIMAGSYYCYFVNF